MIRRLWRAEKAAWKAWRQVWTGEEEPQELDAPVPVPVPEPPVSVPPGDAGGSVLFRVEALVEGVAGVLYEGYSGREARRTIERLRANPSVAAWRAFRDGSPWCDSTR